MRINRFFRLLTFPILIWVFSTGSAYALKVAVVGDTGLGGRAYYKGQTAVEERIKSQRPDVLLHLGDFIYQKKYKNTGCGRFEKEINGYGVYAPNQPKRIFVIGDNDLPVRNPFPENAWDSKDYGGRTNSNCYQFIANLNRFDSDKLQGPAEYNYKRFEGFVQHGNALFVVLNYYGWKDPRPWLKARVEQARREGLWVIVAIHVPPLNTAWSPYESPPILNVLYDLKPDLVVSGDKHSYEALYKRGVFHVISGGGGAKLKPSALDQEGVPQAPEEIQKKRLRRGYGFHYVLLDISEKTLTGTAYQVCTRDADFNERALWNYKKDKGWIRKKLNNAETGKDRNKWEKKLKKAEKTEKKFRGLWDQILKKKGPICTQTSAPEKPFHTFKIEK